MSSNKFTLETQLNKEISTFVRRAKFDNPSISSITTFTSFFSNKLLVIFLIREGVPYSLFKLIQLYTPFTEIDWSNFLDISTKSLQRYKKSGKQFKSIQSEKIIEMAEVTNIGLDVFGDMEKFKLWLDTPSFALGGLKPIELLKDSYGKEMVVGELTRINQGIFS